MKRNEGTIFNIQRFSLHDGPGIRTTVFLKGCNVRCSWCHNPESLSPLPQLSVTKSKCTACSNCIKACKKGVFSINNAGKLNINLEDCNLCSDCVEACPEGAISIIGQTYTAEEVMETVLKDKKYFENSGGGVTFSGGEPTYQYNFLLALLKLSKEAGLNTCVETNGLTEQIKFRALCQYVDLFLIDFKLWDDTLHKSHVKSSNQRVLENIELLDNMKKKMILRCPIIPTINDKPEHFATIKQLHEKYTSISLVELMPYHNTGISKWENIGAQYSLSDIEPPSKLDVERWNNLIK